MYVSALYFTQGQIKTGNPVIDAFLNLGSYAVVAVVAFLIVRYLYEAREKDRAAATQAAEEAHAKREQDWKERASSWEKERGDLFAFRDLSRGEWDKERNELIRQRDLARQDALEARVEAAESRRTANEALGGVRSFLENGQKETLATLRDSNSALKEAAMKERASEERDKAKDRELEMMRGMILQLQRQQRELPPGSGTHGIVEGQL